MRGVTGRCRAGRVVGGGGRTVPGVEGGCGRVRQRVVVWGRVAAVVNGRGCWAVQQWRRLVGTHPRARAAAAAAAGAARAPAPRPIPCRYCRRSGRLVCCVPQEVVCVLLRCQVGRTLAVPVACVSVCKHTRRQSNHKTHTQETHTHTRGNETTKHTLRTKHHKAFINTCKHKAHVMHVCII